MKRISLWVISVKYFNGRDEERVYLAVKPAECTYTPFGTVRHRSWENTIKLDQNISILYDLLHQMYFHIHDLLIF